MNGQLAWRCNLKIIITKRHILRVSCIIKTYFLSCYKIRDCSRGIMHPSSGVPFTIPHGDETVSDVGVLSLPHRLPRAHLPKGGHASNPWVLAKPHHGRRNIGAEDEAACALVSEKLLRHAVVHVPDIADADGDEVADEDVVFLYLYIIYFACKIIVRCQKPLVLCAM